MNETSHTSMSNAQLVKRFERTCLEQYDTFITDDRALYNKNYKIQIAITNELKSRGPAARMSLLALLQHENPQVRLRAAQRVYAVAPLEAKACLQDLAAAGLPDQSLAAGMTLARLEEAPDSLDN